MIIFGWRERTAIEGAYAIQCPVCRTQTTAEIRGTRRWFALFFVPLFPASTARNTTVCTSCGTTFEPGVVSPAVPSAYPNAVADAVPNAMLAGQANVAPPSSAVASSSESRSQQNPFGPIPPVRGAGKVGTPALATVSLIMGLISPLAVLLCFASFITSLCAIVAGHLARGEIKESGGKRSGGGIALTGLIAGYISLVGTLVYACFHIYFVTDQVSNAVYAGVNTAGQTAEERLHEAEMSVVSSMGGMRVGVGNSLRARSLAQSFAESLKSIDNLFFTSERERAIKLSDGQFITHCQLTGDSCAFIVHVPSYRDYKGEVRDKLSELAWDVAVTEVTGVLDKGDQLAVGLRGSLLYGDILVGRVPSEFESGPTPSGDAERDDLLAFFNQGITDQTPDAESEQPEQYEEPIEGLVANDVKSHELEADLVRSSAPDSMSNKPAGETEDLSSAPDLAATVDSSPLGSTPPLSVSSESSQSSRVAAGDDEAGSNEIVIPNASAAARDKSSDPNDASENQLTKPSGRPVGIELRKLVAIPNQGWNINCLEFLNKNKWIAAGKLDSTIEIYDIRGKRKISTSERLDQLQQIKALKVSANDQKLVAGGYSGATAVFDIKRNGQLVGPESLYKHSREAKALEVSSQYSFCLSGGADGTLAWQPFDGRSNSTRTLSTLTAQVQAVYLPPEGDTAMATDGKQLIQFSLRKANATNVFQLGTSYPHTAAFHPAGDRVAVSYGSEIREYATATGQELAIYKRPDNEMMWSLVYHPEQSWLMSGGRGSVTVWNTEFSKQVGRYENSVSLYIQTLGLSADGTRLAIVPASAGQDIEVLLFK